MSGKFSANPYYVEYEDLLKELHQLVTEGKGDSAEADAVRDRMDRPEQELSREELERLNGLSADVYMLQDEATSEPPDEDTKTPPEHAALLKAAWNQEDWQRVLVLLRRGPAALTRDRIAFMRACAYRELGHADTALRFLEYAAQVSPNEPLYRSQLLEQLSQLGRHEQARGYADTYIRDEASPRGLLIQSATVLYRAAKGMPPQAGARVCERAVHVLFSVLPGSFELLPTALVSGNLTLGLCYEAMGELENARSAYDAAVEWDPCDGTALVARGLLQMRTDPEAALDDFQAAARLETPAVAPYVYLANQALRRGDFDDCLMLCDRIVSRTQKPRILALALQWVAIARFELGQPREPVRRAFQAALSLDPLNQQIQHNLRLFEDVTKTARGPGAHGIHWKASVSLDPALMALIDAPVPAVPVVA